MAAKNHQSVKLDRRKRAQFSSPKPDLQTLPPHSDEAERAALGCVLFTLLVEREQQAQVQHEQDELLQQLKPSLFYLVNHGVILRAMITLRMEGHALNVVTMAQWLKDHKLLEEAGGYAYITALPEATPTIFAFPTFLATLKDKALRRWTLQRAVRLNQMAGAEEISPKLLQDEFSEIEERASRIGSEKRATIEILTCDDLRKYEPPTHLRLIGDNEISLGVEGLSILAGPGSVGKSLAAAALALAGAIGKGDWLGRAVHRKFRTLILQAENGKGRLKTQLSEMERIHPELRKTMNEHIYFSAPPQGGLAFHNPDFRSEVRRAAEKFRPDLIIIDTWAQVAAEDAAKDVIDKIWEIRSCFPGGDECAGLCIIAHTSKPRPEQVRRGRALANLVSGSIALINAARTVHMLLPWTEDVMDNRVLFATPKINNGENYPSSVYKRRFGTLFAHDADTDPKTWGDDDNKKDASRAVTPEMLVTVFGSESVLAKSAIVKRMKEKFGVPTATTYAALPGGERPYLDDVAFLTKEKWVELKKEK